MTSEERIRECLTKMILQDSYWGYLFSNISRKEFNIPSPFGVSINDNGNLVLFYNPILVDLMDEPTIRKVLEHEGFHLIDKHITRLMKILENYGEDKKNEISRIWNKAADMAVNYLCKAPPFIKIGDMMFELCHARKYNLEDNQSAEFYFHKILKEYEENEQKSESSKKQGKGSGQSNSSDGDLNIDDHSQWSQSRENESYLVRKAEKEINDLIYKSLKSVRNRGNLPGNLNDMINKALEPPIVPYYQIIRKLIRGSRLTKPQKAYTKVNRKRVYSFFLDEIQMLPFPATRKDMSFKIGVLIDTSGSMNDEKIMEALSGVKDIIEKDKECKTTVIEIDTMIQKEYEVKRVSDIQFDIKGRGGTILISGLERFKYLGVDVVLAFTDAMCDDINNADRKTIPRKIIWVVPERSRVDSIDKTGYIVRVNM